MTTFWYYGPSRYLKKVSWIKYSNLVFERHKKKSFDNCNGEKKMHSETQLARPNTAATLMHKMQHVQSLD